MGRSSTACGGRPTTRAAGRIVSGCRRWRWTLVGQGAARDFVFAGSVGKISGFSKLKTALDEASGVTEWRLHDLRRTAASKMQGLGVPNHIVQAVLNHAVPGVGGNYLQDELEKQKADALATWATAS